MHIILFAKHNVHLCKYTRALPAKKTIPLAPPLRWEQIQTSDPFQENIEIAAGVKLLRIGVGMFASGMLPCGDRSEVGMAHEVLADVIHTMVWAKAVSPS